MVQLDGPIKELRPLRGEAVLGYDIESEVKVLVVKPAEVKK